MPLEQLVEAALCPPPQWACAVTAEPSQDYFPDDRLLQYKRERVCVCVRMLFIINARGQRVSLWKKVFKSS